MASCFWGEQDTCTVLAGLLLVEHDCPFFSEQTQESIQRFEQQAGLRDAGYTPYKGLTTEETRYLRVAEELHKLKLKSGETAKEEKHPASAQSTRSSTPRSSPKFCRPGLQRWPLNPLLWR